MDENMWPMRTAMATEDMPPEPLIERCACCGRTDMGVHVRLHCHPEIGLCDRCLVWLNGQRVREARSQLASRVKNRRCK